MHNVSVSAETDAHTSREGTHFRNPFKDTFVSADNNVMLATFLIPFLQPSCSDVLLLSLLFSKYVKIDQEPKKLSC
jgi:hypothetical protein